MKTLLEQPGFLAPSGTIGADISYLLALVFTILFLMAWRMAKKGQGTRHHKLILVSMVAMIVYFVAYYYARSLGVLSFEGREGFGGPDEIYDNVFVPVFATKFLFSYTRPNANAVIGLSPASLEYVVTMFTTLKFVLNARFSIIILNSAHAFGRMSAPPFAGMFLAKALNESTAP